MNIDTKALKGVIEEVEASRARQKAETELQREAIKAAVKNHQLDAKAIRIVLQRRAMGDEARDEQDYYVHAYEHALGGKKQAADALAAGFGVRETARATGLSVGTVSAIKNSVQKSSELNTTHDADGVIIEDAAPQARVDDGAALTAAAAPPSVVPCSATPQVAEGPDSAAKPAPEGGEGTGTNSDDDDLTIPDYLRGPSPANRRAG